MQRVANPYGLRVAGVRSLLLPLDALLRVWYSVSMGHKIKGRKPECPHTKTKEKKTVDSVYTICKDCGMTIAVKPRGRY